MLWFIDSKLVVGIKDHTWRDADLQIRLQIQ